MNRRALITLSTVLLLSGCSLLHDENEPLNEMRAARRRWEQRNISDYSFELQMSCECPSYRKMRITVVDDTVHSATYVNDGSPVQRGSEPMLLTIDGVFNWLIDELRDEPDKASAWFHQTYFFPEEVYFDRVTSSVDDEFWLYLKNFALPSGQE